MNITAKRERLHQFIDIAHRADIDVLLTYAEQSMQPAAADDRWEDEMFVAEVELGLKTLQTGAKKEPKKGVRKRRI